MRQEPSIHLIYTVTFENDRMETRTETFEASGLGVAYDEGQKRMRDDEFVRGVTVKKVSESA